MKFSLHYTLQSKNSWNSAYQEFLKESILAEELGFYGIYVGEHHFAADGWCPSPIPVLAAAAAVTKQMKLGTDIIVLTLHNPIKVAEDIAVLDNISNGRSILGIGLGYRKEEYAAFSVDFKKKKEIYDDKIKVVKSLLQGEVIKINEFNIRIYPLPTQKPRPPIWLAAKSDEAIKAVLRRGDAWIMDPVTSIHLLEKKVRLFRETAHMLKKHVIDFPLRRECFVSKDKEELKKATESILRSYEEDYYKWGHLMTKEGMPIDPSRVPFNDIKDQLLDEMLIGTPSEVIEKIQVYKKLLGITELLLKIMFPGITHEMRKNSMRTISFEIMPYFKD